MAKTCYARTAGGNWSTDATWSTTTGGAADTTKPVATDTAILDANSGSVTVDAASACAIVTMTNYGATKTFTMNGTLTTTGNVTLPTAAVTFAGTSAWIMTTTCTIVPNGRTLSCPVTFGGSAQTFTINTTPLVTTGKITLPDANITFAGTSGWTAGNLGNATITAARTYTFKEAITYTVTGYFNVFGNSTSNIIAMTSAHASTQTIITLAFSGYQQNGFITPTRIDSSLGQPIQAFYRGTATSCLGWQNIIYYGNVIAPTGGETVAVSGITKDKDGNALVSCVCYLFRDNGNTSATFVKSTTSDAGTGAYSFSVYPGSTYFVVAFKAGATPVMDVTDRTLTAA